jgi:hypothetical protein
MGAARAPLASSKMSNLLSEAATHDGALPVVRRIVNWSFEGRDVCRVTSLLVMLERSGSVRAGAPARGVQKLCQSPRVSSSNSVRGRLGFAGYQRLISRDRLWAARRTDRARLTLTGRIWYSRARVKRI